MMHVTIKRLNEKLCWEVFSFYTIFFYFLDLTYSYKYDNVLSDKQKTIIETVMLLYEDF